MRVLHFYSRINSALEDWRVKVSPGLQKHEIFIRQSLIHNKCVVVYLSDIISFLYKSIQKSRPSFYTQVHGE